MKRRIHNVLCLLVLQNDDCAFCARIDRCLFQWLFPVLLGRTMCNTMKHKRTKIMMMMKMIVLRFIWIKWEIDLGEMYFGSRTIMLSIQFRTIMANTSVQWCPVAMLNWIILVKRSKELRRSFIYVLASSYCRGHFWLWHIFLLSSWQLLCCCLSKAHYSNCILHECEERINYAWMLIEFGFSQIDLFIALLQKSSNISHLLDQQLHFILILILT